MTDQRSPQGSRAEVAWGQIVGARESQQDYGTIVSWPNGFQLLILADGMGGHAGGAEASSLVVEKFRTHFIDDREEDLRQRLINALSRANRQLFDYVQTVPEMEGMGTTLLALLFDGAFIRWISVGDSPLWLYREGSLRRLNENHSVAALLEEQVTRGEISAEAAAAAPDRSQLLSAVMGEVIETVDAPLESVETQPGDIYLLASDGVETCSIPELEQLLSLAGSKKIKPEEIVEDILLHVETHGRKAQDNATIMILQAAPDSSQAA